MVKVLLRFIASTSFILALLFFSFAFTPKTYAVACQVGNVTLDCADGSGCSYSSRLGYYCTGGAGGGTTGTTGDNSGATTGDNSGSTVTGNTGYKDGDSCSYGAYNQCGALTGSGYQCTPLCYTAGCGGVGKCCKTGTTWNSNTGTCTLVSELTPTAPPPVIDPCATNVNKPNTCACTTVQAFTCASKYCKVSTPGASTGTCDTAPNNNTGVAGDYNGYPYPVYCPPGTGYYDSWGRLFPTCAPTITVAPLTCDPVVNGHIDQDDFNLWKQEYLHNISTTRTACMSPNNTVDLLGFQAWKNIAVLHTKTNF